MQVQRNKRVLLAGSTGLTGSLLLEMLLNNESIKEVVVLARKEPSFIHSKLKWRVVDLLSPETWEKHFENIDDVYCCVGTTAAKTPNTDEYEKIDYGIPVEMAKVAANYKVKGFAVLSAVGANPLSKVFYNRLKGKMELAVKQSDIPRIYIFRPSLILGKRKERRMGENIAAGIMRFFSFIIPAKYKAVQASKIATVMHDFVNTRLTEGVYTVSSEEIYHY